MLRQATGALALVLAGLSVSAYGQVKLEWKFLEGDKFYAQTTITTNATIDTDGTKLKHEAKQTIVTSFTVKKKSKKEVVLEQKIESVKVKASGLREGTRAQKLAEEQKGAVFTFTLDPKHKVTRFEGYDNLVEKIAKVSKELGETFRLMYPEETYKKSIEDVFGVLPDMAVDKGDTWVRSMTASQGPLGEFKADLKYKYADNVKEGIQITFTARMTYAPPRKDFDKAPFKVTKGTLKSEKFQGKLIFDARRGRLVSSDLKTVMSGSLTLEIPDMEKPTHMTMKQTQAVSSKILDKNPSDD